MGETDTISFDFMLVMPDADSLVTTYTYEWEPAGQAETPKPGGIITLKGVALSAEAEPMPWMKLDAHVYYGQEEYDESRAPDAVVEGATDHGGALFAAQPAECGFFHYFRSLTLQ